MNEKCLFPLVAFDQLCVHEDVESSLLLTFFTIGDYIV